MKGGKWTVIVALAICVMMVSALPLVSAAKVKTLEERSTWDLDMINVEEVSQTGKGVYIAVLDTGLTPNWKDYFSKDSIMADLGIGFYEDVKWDVKTQKLVESGILHKTSFIGSTGSTHGTHVTSTIIGYNYYSPSDAAAGYPLEPFRIKGVAPDAKIIPVKVLADYHIGASQTGGDYPDQHFVMGTDRMVAAGIDYATSLCQAGYAPMIVTMSLGGPVAAPIIEDAIDRAIDAGVIIVASAGNEGMDGMGWPGAYSQVISVGACGWEYEWYKPNDSPFYRLWWLQDDTYKYREVAEGTSLADDVYITEWSSRELDGQYLDVVAPGSWVRGPYSSGPGYSHLPWWSQGHPANGMVAGSFYYVGGTSMAAPHVTGIAALMLEKNPSLIQEEVEKILKDNALKIYPGLMTVFDYGASGWTWYTYSWEADATGAGLVQADKAVLAVPDS